MDIGCTVDCVYLLKLYILMLLGKLPLDHLYTNYVSSNLWIHMLVRGCYFQEGEEVKMEMSVESAYRRSIQTLVDWVVREVDMNKTRVFFRSYAPIVEPVSRAIEKLMEIISVLIIIITNFNSAGDWKTGGRCHLETMPDLGSLPVSSETFGQLKAVSDVVSEHLQKSNVTQMDVLNVTSLTALRKDGHLSIYYFGPNNAIAPLHRQDCSHWCLPGVPDTWNELLYALFLKGEYNRIQNSNSTQSAPAPV
ncbi:unnamed protein product [Ilex paraguariensis]|uniref:Trichome birefringence-like C-terminal domain-containing protein n=1 Tax=Ilex paraguariensis TaxID=185542 RepID=A0ABC8RWJ7_9AQUA